MIVLDKWPSSLNKPKMFSKPSGCQNRKQKAKVIKETGASAKLLCNYLSKTQNISSSEKPGTNDKCVIAVIPKSFF